MPTPGPLELVIILVIALLVLGPGKLPDVGAALGKSIKEFRKASSDVQEAVSVNVDTSPLPATPVAPTSVAPVAPVAPVEPAPPTHVAAAPIAPVPAIPAAPAVEPAPVPAPTPAPTPADSTTVAS